MTVMGRRRFFLRLFAGLSLGLWFQVGCVRGPNHIEFSTVSSPLGVAYKPAIDACMVCHSTREMQRGPVLDGLPEWYLVEQLQNFKSGWRGKNPANRAGTLMGAAMSKVETDSQLIHLARHFASNQPKPFIRVIRGNIPAGRIHYAVRCAFCHGAKGEGKKEIQSPPLNVQEDWFLLDQLRKFANGQRRFGDANAQLMKAAVAELSPDDLRNLVAYIAKDLTVTPPLPKVGASEP